MSAGVALVTGGAKRIGAAICRDLAKAGYTILIHCHQSHREAGLLAHEIKDSGGKAEVVRGDLAALTGIATFYSSATALFGPPDLLVNNASIFLDDSIETLEPARFAANLATNLQAPLLLARAFAEALPPEQSGAIIHIIDQRVLRPNPRFFSYTLAKSALFTATKTLAQSLAPRIRVNAVGPGPTLPNAQDGPEGLRREAEGTLLGNIVSPEEIARAVRFLAEAPHITGQMIAVDSGQHLGWRTPDILG